MNDPQSGPAGPAAAPSSPPAHNDEMNLAWQFVSGTNVSVFLTGKAGTGKTTFLRRVRELSPKRMVVVAPTGVAAINAQGVTIHSFFQLPTTIYIPGHEYGGTNHYRMSEDKKRIMRTMDLLVIDEVSMVRADLLDAVDATLRKYRDRYRPFGGVQLLLIGDLQQLPPVAQTAEWEQLKDYYASPYFFSSRALGQTSYITIELRTIYRQQDDRFIRLLADIRRGGTPSQDTVAQLNTRYNPSAVPPEGSIRLTTHNAAASEFNERRLAELTTARHSFDASTSGEFPATAYPADKHLVLKRGAQVMFVRNDHSGAGEYYNGKLGTVTQIDAQGIHVTGLDDHKMVCVRPVQWENSRMRINALTQEIEEETIGTFTQYPLRLAWAITIHKSQGLTFDHAVLDINESFAPGQVYVALSRCRTLEGVWLAKPLSLHTLQTAEAVTDFIAQETESAAQTAGRLPELRREYFVTLLSELFTFDSIASALGYVLRLHSEFLYKSHPDQVAQWQQAATSFDTQVTAVARKFALQYNALTSQAADLDRDATLQDRVRKGAAYFAGQLRIFHAIAKRPLPAIGNKATARRVQGAVDTLVQNLAVAAELLQAVSGHGFTTRTYLRDKAAAYLRAVPKPAPSPRATYRNRSANGQSRTAFGQNRSATSGPSRSANGPSRSANGQSRGATTDRTSAGREDAATSRPTFFGDPFPSKRSK